MSELIIIAGPQAAGKSSAIRNIGSRKGRFNGQSSKPPLVFTLQESRQIIAHKNILLGAIFMTPKEECEVVDCDLARMDLIIGRNSKRIVYFDECNIFTIAHAAAHGVNDVALYYDEYISRLKRLKAKVIFIDIPPSVSWERRKQIYEKRLVYFPKKLHCGIMRRYREYLERMAPLLINIFRSLPFPKYIVDGTKDESAVSSEIALALRELSPAFR